MDINLQKAHRNQLKLKEQLNHRKKAVKVQVKPELNKNLLKLREWRHKQPKEQLMRERPKGQLVREQQKEH